MVKALNMDEHHHHHHHHSKYLYTIMEPDAYGNLLNTAPSISSSNYENRSSLRRHLHTKKHHDKKDDERIEVKIVPQDDNWGETTATTITCHAGNDDTLTTNNETTIQINDDHPIENLINKNSSQTRIILIYHFMIYFLCIISYLSPILFLTLPYTLTNSNVILINDYTLLLTIILKFLFLFLGTILLLYRRRNTIYLPRINLYKILFLFILICILLTYWFYYIFKLLHSINIQYEQIFSMTSTYEDLLLYLLIITIITLEIKWLYPKWIVKIVRSPDGQTRQYTIGSMSIQEASIYLLEQYYKDFPVFNPWLENVLETQGKQNGTLTTKSMGSQSNPSIFGGGRDSQRSIRGYNDRFYDELDYERRVQKRRTKLLSSCEDAFTHVRKCLYEKSSTSHISMDAREAAQAVFSSMSRSLQKYLRITRQQPYFTRESIISHLSICLSHDLSPRTFLERYIKVESQPIPTILYPSLNNPNEQSWTILCDSKIEEKKSIMINQSIYSNLILILKQKHAEHIVLICTFHSIPRINLIEKIFNIKTNKFVLKLNSETSV